MVVIFSTIYIRHKNNKSGPPAKLAVLTSKKFSLLAKALLHQNNNPSFRSYSYKYMADKAAAHISIPRAVLSRMTS